LRSQPSEPEVAPRVIFPEAACGAVPWNER
jgi:hypothetical protein